MPADNKHWLAASSAVAAFVIAVAGAYLALDRKVTALAATASTSEQVEHIVDLKTSTRLDEILRRLTQIDARLEQLQHAAHSHDQRQAREQP